MIVFVICFEGSMEYRFFLECVIKLFICIFVEIISMSFRVGGFGFDFYVY